MVEMNDREKVCKDYYSRSRKKLDEPIYGFDKQFFAINFREI